MKTIQVIMFFIGMLCTIPSISHAQPTTLRIEGDGFPDDPYDLDTGNTFTLDLTFDDLARLEDDEIMSIFLSTGSFAFSSGGFNASSIVDDMLVFATKGGEEVELTLDAFSPSFSLAINKRSPIDGTPPISVDDLLGFFVDGNIQDADVFLSLDDIIVQGTVASVGGDITSISLIPEPALGIASLLPMLLAIGTFRGWRNYASAA